MEPGKLTLYYLTGSRASRILWLLMELKLDFKVVYIPQRSGPAYEELGKVSPTKESPCLVTEDGTALVESGYIMDYLLRKYGESSPIAGNNEKEKEDIRLSLFACEGNLMTGIIQLAIFARAKSMLPMGISYLVGKLLDKVADAYATGLTNRQLTALDERLRENGGWYTGGHLSAADIMYHYVVDLNRNYNAVPDLLERYPNIAKWDSEISKLENYQKSLLPSS